MFHLDTDTVIAFLNGNQKVTDAIKAHLPDIAISSLVFAELLFGARASARCDENIEKLNRMLSIIEVVDFDLECARTYSEDRLSLKQKGRPTGEMDLLIGSVALTRGSILVTHNTKHFQHIDGLLLDDWSV